MAHSSRRRFLKDFLGGLARGTGTVVIATAATVQALARVPGGKNTDIQKRAEELAGAAGASEDNLPVNFLNGAFRNGGFANGGFRNGGFANGSFRNGGFANGGGFRNGGFANGGFRNW
jgi:rSAM-associated Gly-rich repeat protein